MQQNNFFLAISSLLFLFPFYAGAFNNIQENAKGWKAGVARVVITPRQPMWMSGYISRTHPSEGVLHDLWAKALVVEDAEGEQAVMISTDLRGVPKSISDGVRNKLQKKYNFSKKQILLNSSHTHSGPVLYDVNANYLYISPRDSQEKKKIEQYSNRLENDLVALVGRALDRMVPVQIYTGNGVARFAVNRRNNDESTVHQLTQLAGPIDHSVPVLKVTNEAGELIAVTFGYACHPTVLNIYRWSGDYPGFAQLELEKLYPGVTALFFQGAGGDQNPLPRRSVSLAQQYGRELASAVDRVLKEDMHQLAAQLVTAYSEVELPFTSPPEKKDLLKIAKESSGYQKEWAISLIDKINSDEPLPISYPYPVQVWRLGNQSIISLGGELVIAYAIELKRVFGQDIFVFGYSNDVMSYIPSATILKEGGYEGASSQMVRGMPSPWKASIEILILQEVIKLAGHADIPPTEKTPGK